LCHLLCLKIGIKHRVELTDEASQHVKALTSAELLSVSVSLTVERTEYTDNVDSFFMVCVCPVIQTHLQVCKNYICLHD